MTEPLAERLARRIAARGPLTLAEFWNAALFDPVDGYYTSRRPFGAEGDFITAPDVSQMFGELVGAWLVAAWRALGSPSPFALVEIGPGRGTLMADILRTVRQLDTGFSRAARVHLIEVSDRLAGIQHERLSGFDLPLRRHRSIDRLPAMPLLAVANELFDAIAIRQFVHDGTGLQERLVATAPGGGFRFVEGPAGPIGVPARLPPPRAGDILEVSPDRRRLAARLASMLAQRGGAFLSFDYGHAQSGYGDTLQAMRSHAFADPLAEPGLHDITSHVDFADLAETMRHAGVAVSPIVTQGQFLLALGLAERAGALGATRDAAGRAEIASQAHRLAGTGPGEMGDLFKVVAAGSTALPLPPFD